MTQPGSHAGWIQHDLNRVQRAAEFLPHLWREVTPDPDATTATRHDHNHDAAAQAAAAQARLAEAEARFAAELATVRAEAEQWRTHAQTVAVEAQAQGFAAGYAEGERQGRRDGEAAVHTAAQQEIERLATLAAGGIVAMQDALVAAHEMLATLSVAVARAIVGEAFAHDPALLARRIVTLLERLSDVTTATVRLHPTDLAVVQAHWPGLAHAYGWGEQGPRLLGDDALAPGDCVIEARTHYLDARIETLSELVRETFAAVPMTPMPDMTSIDNDLTDPDEPMLAKEAA